MSWVSAAVSGFLGGVTSQACDAPLPQPETVNKTVEAAAEVLSPDSGQNVALGMPPILEPHPPHYEIIAREVYGVGGTKFA